MNVHIDHSKYLNYKQLHQVHCCTGLRERNRGGILQSLRRWFGFFGDFFLTGQVDRRRGRVGGLGGGRRGMWSRRECGGRLFGEGRGLMNFKET